MHNGNAPTNNKNIWEVLEELRKVSPGLYWGAAVFICVGLIGLFLNLITISFVSTILLIAFFGGLWVAEQYLSRIFRNPFFANIFQGIVTFLVLTLVLIIGTAAFNIAGGKPQSEGRISFDRRIYCEIKSWKVSASLGFKSCSEIASSNVPTVYPVAGNLENLESRHASGEGVSPVDKAESAIYIHRFSEVSESEAKKVRVALSLSGWGVALKIQPSASSGPPDIKFFYSNDKDAAFALAAVVADTLDLSTDSILVKDFSNAIDQSGKKYAVRVDPGYFEIWLGKPKNADDEA